MMLPDLIVRLHAIVSRLSREGGDKKEMATLGEAAARIVLLERSLGKLIVLMEDTPYPEMHPDLNTVQRIIDGQ